MLKAGGQRLELAISNGSQAYIFIYSVLGGILIAFLYDVFRVKRKAIKTKSVYIHIEDLVYWVLATLIMFAVIYYSNEGEIRGYMFLGTIIGAILYGLLLSSFIMRLFLFTIRILARIFKTIYRILSYPFRILYKILSMPFSIMLRISRRITKKVRRIGKSKLTKLSIWRRIFKNIRKKI